MTQIAFIAIGGALGCVLRYLMSLGAHTLFGRGFPYGTLSVNITGSLLIGILYILFYERMDISAEWRAGLIIGVLGGFTTFSSFSIETLNLIETGEQMKALANVLLNVTLSLVACWFGMVVTRQI